MVVLPREAVVHHPCPAVANAGWSYHRPFLGQPNYGAAQAANAKCLKSEVFLESHFPCNGPE